MDKINTIRPDKHDYLSILECLDTPAGKLYYRGELPSERRTTVAIVGTRKPTSYGREVTSALAGALARRGVVIVSGLALGVDAIAHQAALEQNGTTLAVLAHGLHRIYPATNRGLAETILASGGALLSEYQKGEEPLPYRFLERNRIVSGLSDAVIITEAAARSGTLHTAAQALAQGKDVFVVPGPITSPMSAGCNTLLAQGAQPITSIAEAVESIAPSGAAHDNREAVGGNRSDAETAILTALASGIRDGDALLEATDLGPTDFSSALTLLEMNGDIQSLGANRWGVK